MRKVKSLIITLLISIVVFGTLYMIPVEIRSKEGKELVSPMSSQEEELLGEREDVIEEKVDVSPVVSEEPVTSLEKPITEINKESTPSLVVETRKETIKAEKEDIAKKEEQKRAEEKKKEEDKKLADKKAEETKKQSQKESKIGVDRKLIAGIPGTMKYKGVLPPHNVREKGSITISYTVDPSGNVISAYRTAGLRDKNTINNAATLVRKYVKAEKGKTNSTGTYTIEFK